MGRKRPVLITGALFMSVTIISGLALYVRANALPPEREIQITAKNFEFTPDTITLKKGEPVVLVLSSQERKHGFSLRGFGIRADVKPGETVRLSFTPNKTGKFIFSCDVFCGEGHEDMTEPWSLLNDGIVRLSAVSSIVRLSSKMQPDSSCGILHG